VPARDKTDLEKHVPPEKLDQFLLAVEEFNQEQYLECHENFEDVWRLQTDPYREVTQGIIQFAVGLHHLGHNNKLGAAKLFRRALDHLTPFQDSPSGINVKQLCKQLSQALTLTQQDAPPPADKPEKIQIELTDKLFQES
jgi:uncharacterized protein